MGVPGLPRRTLNAANENPRGTLDQPGDVPTLGSIASGTAREVEHRGLGPVDPLAPRRRCGNRPKSHDTGRQRGGTGCTTTKTRRPAPAGNDATDTGQARISGMTKGMAEAMLIPSTIAG